jgi:polynucleotide 5'-hydroxyl-kinase GRC3/NOL9
VSERGAAALAAAAAAPVTMVIGASDTGKSTLVTLLAAALAAAGHSVAVVDADLGQSDVGPPTTVGLGLVPPGLTHLRDATVIGLEFLGVTSPATCMPQTADATARLARRALARGCTRVLVNTSGLVEGPFGRALKRLKIERVAPDLLLVLERAAECEAIVGPYATGARPAVVRLGAAPTTRRSAAVRRESRQRGLQTHLAGASLGTLDLDRVAVRAVPSERDPLLLPLDGALVGLATDEGDVQGLGVVHALDLERACLTVRTRVDLDRVATVLIGREREATL